MKSDFDKVFIVIIKNKNKEVVEKDSNNIIHIIKKYLYQKTSNIPTEIKNDKDTLFIAILMDEQITHKIDKAFLGTCRFDQDSKWNVHIRKTISAPLFLENLDRNIENRFNSDLSDGDIINKLEYSSILIDIAFNEVFISNEALKSNKKQKYSNREEEDYLSNYAQRNQNCYRMWGLSGEEVERSEFQRDRERIVNSKAFRRLVDKAQIFTSSKGDHYRTRMTHTLEVAQIARSIANSLKVNIDLTEAIALAHDLGHTPFGHQGERTLDDILNHRIDLLPMITALGRNPYGGFKHNFQSIRVLTFLEEKYIAYPGLDVSFGLLEGVLKHTKVREKKCFECQDGECVKCCDIKEFIDSPFDKELYLEYKFATTLEGQVVAIADEIAQRGHDIDDAFTSGLLKIEEFKNYLKHQAMKPLHDIIKETFKELEECTNREQINETDMFCTRIISDIIGYLVNDVIDETKRQIEDFLPDDMYDDKHRFSKLIVDFSTSGKSVCELLNKLISKKVVNCHEVTKFDKNASHVIEVLFRNYYRNPKLMQERILQRMHLLMKKETGNVVNFIDGDLDLIKEEIKLITDLSVPENKIKWNSENQEYFEKHKILVRCITDCIAGMTDSYAMNEYNSLLGQ